LEAVYHPQQVPHSAEVLTLLGFVFDRAYFPGVYMPPDEGLDEQGLREEIKRILGLPLKTKMPPPCSPSRMWSGLLARMLPAEIAQVLVQQVAELPDPG
jgi:hypothetical protein